MFKINSTLGVDVLREKYQEQKRLQISNFLEDQSAAKIESVLRTLDWRLVLNENGKHFDIHQSQIEALGVDKMKLIVDGAKQRKHTQFQYIYKNFPIADMIESGNLKEGVLEGLYKTWNDSKVISFLNQITDAGVEFCDMQATNFQAGHFLNHHDDEVAGKNRKFAYVYSLCRDWSSEFGGALEFFDNAGNLVESFVPRYNTLSIFRVPAMHQVSAVLETCRKDRLSITGWFRTFN